MTALAVMNLLARGAQREAERLAFAGQDLRGLSERGMARLRGDRMAMIFQEPMTSLNPAYTVGSQMTEVLRRHRAGVTPRAATDRAAELLARVGITAPGMRLGQFPHQLSGGLRQRVMIAMALMCDPELLIADEPTTALDVTVQAQILRLLAELQRDLGLGMLLITHDLGIVARIADRVSRDVRRRGGRKRADRRAVRQPPASLHARPAALRAGARQGHAATSRWAASPAWCRASRPGFAGCGFRDRCAHADRDLRRHHPAPRAPAPGHELPLPLARLDAGAGGMSDAPRSRSRDLRRDLPRAAGALRARRAQVRGGRRRLLRRAARAACSAWWAKAAAASPRSRG